MKLKDRTNQITAVPHPENEIIFLGERLKLTYIGELLRDNTEGSRNAPVETKRQQLERVKL